MSGAVSRRVWGAALTLAILLLPALVGGVGIDQPPRLGEPEALARALEAPSADAVGSALVSYYGAAVPRDAIKAGAPASRELLPQARRAAVLGLLVVTGLLYLTVLMTRGRLTALFACLALAALPPAGADGYVLRAATPVAAFGGLATLVLMGFPVLIAQHRGLRRLLVAAVSALAVGAGLGLAVACGPRAGIYLLVPGFGLLLALAVTLLLGARAVRRCPGRPVPTVAMQSRVLPWVVLTVIVLGAAGGVSSVAMGGTAPFDGVVCERLLPHSAWLQVPLIALAGLGALRLVLAVGAHMGRRARVTPAALLVFYVGALILQRGCGGGDVDALLAAPALSIMVAEGALVTLYMAARALCPAAAREDSPSTPGAGG
ncbi:MAG: hypothetical protein AAF628_01650 [Planctomycetota bacterium]